MLTQPLTSAEIFELKNQARTHLSKKEYDKAEECFFKIPDFYELGHMHERKENPDYILAKDYYERSANQGNPYALNNLGVLYSFGKGVPRDLKKALEYFEKALQIKPRTGLFLYNIGYIYDMESNKFPQNLPKALIYYKDAGENGYGKIAFRRVGGIYGHGFPNVPQDFKQAFFYFQQAANLGDIESLFTIGWFYFQGRGRPKDLKKALEYYQKAADQGHPESQYYLGLHYEIGHGVKKNMDKAIDYYQKSKTAESFEKLARIYEKSSDFPKAITYFRKAADKKNNAAIEWLSSKPLSISPGAEIYQYLDLMIYHAAMITDSKIILETFKKQFLEKPDVYIRFLEDNFQDTADKIQNKFSDFSDKIFTHAQSEYFFKFFAILHCLHVNDLSKLVLQYYMDASFIKILDFKPQVSKEKNSFHMFYHEEKKPEDVQTALRKQNGR